MLRMGNRPKSRGYTRPSEDRTLGIRVKTDVVKTYEYGRISVRELQEVMSRPHVLSVSARSHLGVGLSCNNFSM